jgi:hypothetical protein
MARLSTVRCKVLAVHRRGIGEYFCRNGKDLYGSAAVEATVKGIAVGQVVTFKAIPSQGHLTCQRSAEGHTPGPPGLICRGMMDQAHGLLRDETEHTG